MIDAHHHLWKLSRADYGWIGGRSNPAVAPIERDYLVEDYRIVAAANGIAGSIVVQAAQTVAETRWLLDQARASGGLIKGVVGWIDMAAANAPDALHDLAQDRLLRSIRPMLQEIADVEWVPHPGRASVTRPESLQYAVVSRAMRRMSSAQGCHVAPAIPGLAP